MRNTFVILILVSLLIISCNKRQPNRLEIQLIESLKNANNKRDYNQIKPFLSNDFHFIKSDINTSFTSLYAYINYSLSEKIVKIDINYVKKLDDSLFEIRGEKFYKNYPPEKLNLVYKITVDEPKIVKMNNLEPHRFSLTTRASYRNEEIFGNNRVENITNLLVLDTNDTDSLHQDGYTLYYSENLKIEAKKALILFRRLDSLLINRFKIEKIERENLYLLNSKANNTIIIGKNSNIPWSMALYESDSINNGKLINKIGNTFSHEIIEGTLVKYYNLKGYSYRWFRDGLSEYIAYEYCKIIAPKEAKRYFLENRLSLANQYKMNGNLLDWRGNGAVKDANNGKLYGSKFIYFNDVGQYGRAFKFFKDLFEKDDTDLILILDEIQKEKNVSVEKLLEIMSSITNKNIEKKISNY